MVDKIDNLSVLKKTEEILSYTYDETRLASEVNSIK